MPFNIAFARLGRGTGSLRIFQTVCTSKEELQRSLDGYPSEDEEVVVDFLSFESDVAQILSALSNMPYVGSEIMDIVRKIHAAAR